MFIGSLTPVASAVTAVDRNGQQVGGADKAGDEGGLRLVVELAGSGDLLDVASVHDGDPVRHGEGLFLVVSDVDESGSCAMLDRLELELHLLAQLHVERAERLVEQQGGRLVYQGPGERDTLSLAAG